MLRQNYSVKGRFLWSEPENPVSTCWQSGVMQIENGLIKGFERLSFGDVPNNWVTPGLVDAHCHLSLGSDGPLPISQAVTNLYAELDAGVLTIREPGSPIANDTLEAEFSDKCPLFSKRSIPTIIRSGRHIALPKRYLPGIAIELDDSASLPDAIASQLKENDCRANEICSAESGESDFSNKPTRWIKLVGDWIDRSSGTDSDLKPLWQRRDLFEAVQVAHDLGARVAVHSFSTEAIDDLLFAGVDSIEHGSGMNADQASQAAKDNIPVTPTLGQLELFPIFAKAGAKKYPRYAQTMLAMFNNRFDWFSTLVESGVQLLPGTDAGGYQAHGQMPRELLKWREYGLDGKRILDFATWRAKFFLGVPGLQIGAAADYVIYDKDPAGDPETFSDPREVVLSGQRWLSKSRTKSY